MKRWVIGLLGVALSAQTSLAVGLVVGIDENFPPFEFKNQKTGAYEGFDIDLWKAVAREAKFQYSFQPMPFKEILPALQAAQLDVAMASITITADRSKRVDFSRYYYRSGLLLLVPLESRVKGIKDLTQKKVGAKMGTTSVDYLNTEAPEVELVLFPNDSTMLRELLTGGLDAVLSYKPVVLTFMLQQGKGKVKTVGKLYAEQQYGIGFPKGSQLVSEVNSALRAIQQSGEYKEIHRKWFGESPQK